MKTVIASVILFFAAVLLVIDTMDNLSSLAPMVGLTEPEFIQTLLLLAIAVMLSRGSDK